MSNIFGSGYGDDHDWQRGGTNQVGSWGTKATHYQCANCKQQFSHYYDYTPDIFQALENAEGVTEHCPASGVTEESPNPLFNKEETSK